MELQSKMGNSGKTCVTCKPKKLEAWEQGYRTLAYQLWIPGNEAILLVVLPICKLL